MKIQIGIFLLLTLLLGGFSIFKNYFIAGKWQDKTVIKYIEEVTDEQERELSKLAKNEIRVLHDGGINPYKFRAENLEKIKKILHPLDFNSASVCSKNGTFDKIDIYLGRERTLIFSPDRNFDISGTKLFESGNWCLYGIRRE